MDSLHGAMGGDESIAAMAESLIVRHRLRREDGTVMCWGCFAGDALMPHLHCQQCYDDWKARNR